MTIKQGDRIPITRPGGSPLAQDVPVTDVVPAGGATGQALRKKSSTDFDMEFGNEVPAGGMSGQVLTKNASGDYLSQWASLQHKLVAGGGAGDVTVTGIKVGDILTEVIEYVYAAGVTTNVLDLTSEFSITPTPTGTISHFSNNLSGGTTVSKASGADPAAGPVTISGTTSYNGTHTASAIVAGVSFDIDVPFAADDATGSYLGIPVNGVINNTGGSNTTGNKLLVRWTKLTA